MEIKGLIPAMATPMHADGSLNLDGVKPLVDKLLAMARTACSPWAAWARPRR